MSMVQRLVGPNRLSAMALGDEVGVPPSTLSRWLREAGTVSSMKHSQSKEHRGEPARAVPSKRRSPQERFRLLLEATGLSEDELGAFLRREGLNETQITQWRAAALQGLREPSMRGRSPKDKEIRKLQSELRRKDKALAETAALLVLRGKAEALWGEGGANIRTKSDKRPSRS